ncbi:MAG: hypothetical protein WD060_01745 [Pirellulales bacterium]
MIILAGVPINVVSETLGHSRPSIMIDIDVHMMPCQHSVAADAMDEMFKYKTADGARLRIAA